MSPAIKRVEDAKAQVKLWLESVSRACLREVDAIDTLGDIADGEIEVPWKLLQDAIAELRNAQTVLRLLEEEATLTV